MNRRSFVKSGSAAFLYAGCTTLSHGVEPITTTERQKGDPNAQYEKVTFNPSLINSLVSSGGKASFEPWDKNLPSKMIASCASFVGVSRDTAPDQVSEFLALFQLPYTDSNGFVAFCAAGLSYCALMAFTKALPANRPGANKLETFRQYLGDIDRYYFYPTVSCLDMYNIA